MFNLMPLRNALQEKSKKRRQEFSRTGDVRFEWAANLLDRFEQETSNMLNLGEMDQIEQAYTNDSDGAFARKVEDLISKIGFERQYGTVVFLVHDILDGEPKRPTSAKAEAEFDRLIKG
ncbi:hypothetical protein GR138_12135 [Shinella kummerowiae]|uniref:Uncharacterized protein n=1 Tax=Shinella kummerowiae TaxID=417745 RepID=A0A6N8SBD3_9HYPH|nr:hypothetical protein [Shinella kummerowiae]MXN45943.1 hypothetical protein [Shinella kummerowiae]